MTQRSESPNQAWCWLARRVSAITGPLRNSDDLCPPRMCLSRVPPCYIKNGSSRESRRSHKRKTSCSHLFYSQTARNEEKRDPEWEKNKNKTDHSQTVTNAKAKFYASVQCESIRAKTDAGNKPIIIGFLSSVFSRTLHALRQSVQIQSGLKKSFLFSETSLNQM